MTSPFDAEIEGLLASYREQVSQVSNSIQQMRSLTASATAPRRTVQVTVNSQGEVVALEFPVSRYKELPPAELSAIIMATIAEARADVGRQVAEMTASAMPGSVDIETLRSGSLGLGAMLPDEPQVHEGVQRYVTQGRPADDREA